ncbi:hypothetical protein [Laceyella putida]|uniref:Phage abortive infection protein n=1 Tax=Laceyella putida TaxID=110101 RepID=A0ABW2RRG8_9BACL
MNRKAILQGIFKWMIGLIVIAVLMMLAYFGFKIWMEYANSDSFKGEVNAAIITGLVGILTLIGTSVLTAYFNYRSQRLTIRDEMFKKRWEVYNELKSIARLLYFKIDDFIHDPSMENIVQIQNIQTEFTMYFEKNSLYLSTEVKNRAMQYRWATKAFVDLITQKNSEWFDAFLEKDTISYDLTREEIKRLPTYWDIEKPILEASTISDEYMITNINSNHKFGRN